MAKKKAPPKRGASRNSPPAKKPVPGWFWLACGLAIGGFVMFLAKLEPGREEVKRSTEEERPAVRPQQPAKPKYDFYTLLPESKVVTPPGAQPQEAVPTPPVPPKPEVQPPKLTPEQDAARAAALLEGRTPPPIAPPAAKPAIPLQQPSPQQPAKPTASPQQPVPQQAAKPAKPAASTQFFLQAGSFRSKGEAESTRARIAMLGQNARIEVGQVRGETYHRVIAGPYASRQQADQAQKQLAGSGFRNLLQQERQIR